MYIVKLCTNEIFLKLGTKYRCDISVAASLCGFFVFTNIEFYLVKKIFVAAPTATIGEYLQVWQGKEKPKALCAFKCAKICVGKEVKQN